MMSRSLTLEVDALDRANAVQAENITRALINNRGRGKRKRLERTLEEKVLLVKRKIEERERERKRIHEAN